MVAQVWLVRKVSNDPVVDGIVAAIINEDSVDTEATVLATAHTKAIAGGHAIPASGYFTSAENALAAGNMDTDQDAIFFGDRATTDVLA